MFNQRFANNDTIQHKARFVTHLQCELGRFIIWRVVLYEQLFYQFVDKYSLILFESLYKMLLYNLKVALRLYIL